LNGKGTKNRTVLKILIILMDLIPEMSVLKYNIAEKYSI